MGSLLPFSTAGRFRDSGPGARSDFILGVAPVRLSLPGDLNDAATTSGQRLWLG